MATIYDCSDNAGLLTGMRLARTAIGRGELVVIPTDTVYGVAADAFDPAAVQRLLDAKGRTRQAPPPVLIADAGTLEALAEEVPEQVRTLVAAYWPGGLTIILPARKSLSWDLGETNGTVALRMPSNRVALELLSETGPLAVSSANLSGHTAASTAAAAEEMLGDSIAVYLDGGEAGAEYDGTDSGAGSTIVDATGLLREGGELKVVREGVIASTAIFALLEEAAAESTTDAPDDNGAATDAGHTVDTDGAAAESFRGEDFAAEHAARDNDDTPDADADDAPGTDAPGTDAPGTGATGGIAADDAPPADASEAGTGERSGMPLAPPGRDS